MTTPKYPKYPPEIPSSVGMTYCDAYRGLRQSMIVAAEDGASAAEVATLAGRIAELIEHDTPRASAKLKSQIWDALREWNEVCAAHEGQPRVFTCNRCGEYRADNVECEGKVIRHARLISVESSSRTPGTRRRALIEPEGCHHASFLIVCKSCNHAHDGYEPVVKDDAGDKGGDTNNYSIN